MPNVKIKNYLDEEKSYANVNKVWLTRDGGGQETVFAEQTVEFFDMTEAGIPGIWLCYGDFSTAFAVGDTVTVKFDGTEYTCIAFDGAAIGLNENVGIGNTSIGGIGEDTGEPFFAINGVGGSGEIQFAFYTTISGDSHVLAISKATGGGSSLVPFTYGELVENAQISLDFSGGNQKLSVPDGSLVKEATILKPDNLTPENIKQGVDIAGVSGRYVPETEVATVNLDFSSGDMTVRPSAGKTFSGVDILKPATLIPANVAKDVTIAGITGTHEGGGGGAAGPYVEYELNEEGRIVKVTPCGFTHIPDYMFGCTGYAPYFYLSEVDFSKSPNLVNVGDHAFYNCTNLTSVYIPDLATWCSIDFGYTDSNPLQHAKNLYVNGELATSIVIPDSVTSIGENAFHGYDSLTSVVIPGSVTLINGYAFSGCSNLTSVTIGSGVTSIGNAAFESCSNLTSVVIPGSVTLINGFAFQNCSSLTSVTIENGVTSIGGWAFYNCRNLTSIVIPDSVTSIGDGAFYNCRNLTSIVIPDSVTSIGKNAFYATAYYNNSANWTDDVLYMGSRLIAARATISGTCTIKPGTKHICAYAFESCSNLTSVVIPGSVTLINGFAFQNCSSLTSVTIENGVTNLGAHMFYNCTSLTKIAIPDSVTVINERAFYKCTGLTQVTIPDSVIDVSNGVFQDCSKLTSVTIGSGVTRIGIQMFYYCSSLTNIVIPEGVVYIGLWAFSGCSKLTSATFKDTTTWYVTQTVGASSGTTLSSSNLANTSTAATWLRSTYYQYYWYKN